MGDNGRVADLGWLGHEPDIQRQAWWVPVRQAEPLRSLKNRNFRWFFFGETINTAGSSMSGIALAFAVLHIDNSATALGWVLASSTAPMVTFMLIGGAVADRLPRALVLRGCNLIEGVTQLTSAVLVLTGTAHIWQLVVLQFASGTAVSVSYPAFHGMVPVLLTEPDRKSAYLLLSQSRSALRILGPAAAGILVATSNPGWALAIDAATYFVAAFFLTLVKLPSNARSQAKASVMADFREGWSFARQLGWVLPVACCSLVFNALTSGALNVLGPTIAKSSAIGSDGWGYGRAAQAIGLFAFTFALARINLRRPLLATEVGFVTSAIPMIALALIPHTAALLVAFFVSGCGSAVLDLSWSMTVQEKIPEQMLSRINAIDGFFSFVAMPLGQIAVGPASQLFTEQEVELGAAALCVVTFIFGITRAPLRQLRIRVPGSDEDTSLNVSR